MKISQDVTIYIVENKHIHTYALYRNDNCAYLQKKMSLAVRYVAVEG